MKKIYTTPEMELEKFTVEVCTENVSDPTTTTVPYDPDSPFEF